MALGSSAALAGVALCALQIEETGSANDEVAPVAAAADLAMALAVTEASIDDYRKI